MTFWRTWSSHERGNFILACTIGLFTVVNAVATACYVRIYNRSSRETGQQAERLIYAASIQAHAAQDLRTAAATQAQQMTTLATQAIEQAKAANALATQGRRSVEKMQEQFQFDQRPRIVVGNFHITLPEPRIINGIRVEPILVKGQPVAVTFYFKNVGKSAAFHVKLHRHLLLTSQLPQFRIEPRDGPEVREGILDSGGDPSFTTAISLKDTFQNESAIIPESEIVNWDGSDVFVFGRIYYEDSFGTSFCTPYMDILANAGTRPEIGVLLEIPDDSSHRPITALCPVGKY